MFKWIIILIFIFQLCSTGPKFNDDNLTMSINDNTIISIVEIGLKTTKTACNIMNSILDCALENITNSKNNSVIPGNEQNNNFKSIVEDI